MLEEREAMTSAPTCLDTCVHTYVRTYIHSYTGFTLSTWLQNKSTLKIDDKFLCPTHI